MPRGDVTLTEPLCPSALWIRGQIIRLSSTSERQSSPTFMWTLTASSRSLSASSLVGMMSRSASRHDSRARATAAQRLRDPSRSRPPLPGRPRQAEPKNQPRKATRTAHSDGYKHRAPVADTRTPQGSGLEPSDVVVLCCPEGSRVASDRGQTARGPDHVGEGAQTAMPWSPRATSIASISSVSLGRLPSGITRCGPSRSAQSTD